MGADQLTNCRSCEQNEQECFFYANNVLNDDCIACRTAAVVQDAMDRGELSCWRSTYREDLKPIIRRLCQDWKKSCEVLAQNPTNDEENDCILFKDVLVKGFRTLTILAVFEALFNETTNKFPSEYMDLDDEDELTARYSAENIEFDSEDEGTEHAEQATTKICTMCKGNLPIAYFHDERMRARALDFLCTLTNRCTLQQRKKLSARQVEECKAALTAKLDTWIEKLRLVKGVQVSQAYLDRCTARISNNLKPHDEAGLEDEDNHADVVISTKSTSKAIPKEIAADFVTCSNCNELVHKIWAMEREEIVACHKCRTRAYVTSKIQQKIDQGENVDAKRLIGNVQGYWQVRRHLAPLNEQQKQVIADHYRATVKELCSAAKLGKASSASNPASAIAMAPSNAANKPETVDTAILTNHSSLTTNPTSLTTRSASRKVTHAACPEAVRTCSPSVTNSDTTGEDTNIFQAFGAKLNEAQKALTPKQYEVLMEELGDRKIVAVSVKTIQWIDSYVKLFSEE